MDLNLYLRVLWRFRLLVGTGLLFALALSLLATLQLSFRDGLKARGEYVWVSNARMLMTQRGFPQGRLDLGNAEEAAEDEAAPAVPRHFADPGRFTDLAVFYARLAETAPVRELVFRRGPIEGAMTVEVAPLEDPRAGLLPMIQVTALGSSRAAAVALARRQTNALRQYVHMQQVANGIEPANRVVLAVVDEAGAPPFLRGENNTWLLSAPSLMRPVIVFVAIMGLVVALAFVLENTRPRIRGIREPTAVAEEAPVRARSA